MEQMLKNRGRTEKIVLVTIILVAIFFRFYLIDKVPGGLWVDEAANGTDALRAMDENDLKIFYPNNNGREGLFIGLISGSIKLFGNEIWVLRLPSAIAGVLTVIGLYFLTKLIFTWQVGAISSFLLAISFWHVNFSRISFRAILLPLVLVWSFYFLWRGIKHGRIAHFALSGLILGLGFYTYLSVRVAPLIIILLFINYWLFLKKDFSGPRYEQMRNHILRGFSALFLSGLIIALPLLVYFWSNPDYFIGRQSQISVLGSDTPIVKLAESTIRTLAMFNFFGDYNMRHNFSGQPQLPWPLGIFFIIGLIRETVHWFGKKHGHFSPIHTFLLLWFTVMLIPGILSGEAPHALRNIGVLPVVMIFTGAGMWWCLDKISDWYGMNEPYFHKNKGVFKHEAKTIQAVVTVIFLVAVGFYEYDRYFVKWAHHPETPLAFSVNAADIGLYARNKDLNTPLFIVVNEPGVIVDGISIFAEPIKYLTRTHSLELAIQKKIYYVNEEYLSNFYANTQMNGFHYNLIAIRETPAIQSFTRVNKLRPENHGTFTVYSK